MKIKIPTLEDYLSFDGRSCHIIWAQLGDDWRCPGCNRTKFEIMRWTNVVDLTFNGPGKKYYMGWSANLHRHHDHSQCKYADFGKGRFDEIIICIDCNAADGSAKRKLELPNDFSFSPHDISHFISSTPHGKHKIDYDKAMIIYNKYRTT